MQKLVMAVFALSSFGLASAQVTTGDFDGNGSEDLRIQGNKKRQNVLIVDRPAVPQVVVSLDQNGDGDFDDAADLDAQVFAPQSGDFETLVLVLGNGNDEVQYVLDSALSVRRALVVDFGSGSHTLTVTANGPLSLAGGELSLDVRGKKGSQETVAVNLQSAAANGTALAFRLELGGGKDGVSIQLPSFTGDNSVHLDADLGGKNDTFSLIAGQPIAGQTSVRSRIDGGGGVDAVDVDLTSSIDGDSTLEIDADLGDGNDSFDVFVDRATFSLSQAQAGARVLVRADGGNGNDGLFLTSGLTAGTVFFEGLLDVAFRGGPGNDAMLVGFDLPSALGFVTPDTGLLRLRLDGGDGNDVVNTNLSNDASSFPRYDVVSHGGAGDDLLTFGAINPGQNTSANYGPAAAIVADGGDGEDQKVTYGNAAAVVERGFEAP